MSKIVRILMASAVVLASAALPASAAKIAESSPTNPGSHSILDFGFWILD